MGHLLRYYTTTICKTPKNRFRRLQTVRLVGALSISKVLKSSLALVTKSLIAPYTFYMVLVHKRPPWGPFCSGLPKLWPHCSNESRFKFLPNLQAHHFIADRKQKTKQNIRTRHTEI